MICNIWGADKNEWRDDDGDVGGDERSGHEDIGNYDGMMFMSTAEHIGL